MATQHTTDHAAQSTRTERRLGRALGPLQLALAVLFLAVGVATLIGPPDVRAQFGVLSNVTGLGAWVRTATGALEVLGGVLLCVRAAAGVGAVLLGAVMVGAALTHVFALRTAPTAPVVLAAVLACIAYAHRDALAVVAARIEENL